jgi:autocrine motility factor receptor
VPNITIRNFFIAAPAVPQTIFFGRLTHMESRKLTERVINYVVFKVVFVGAVVEHELVEIFLWSVWFAALGFLKLFAGLVRDRCEWLASAPVAVPAGAYPHY